MEKTEREKLWGGEINPLPSKVEVSRLSPPKRERRRTPLPRGRSKSASWQEGVWGVKWALGGEAKRDESRLSPGSSH